MEDKKENPKHLEAYQHKAHDLPFYSVPQISELYEPIMQYMRNVKDAYTYQIRDAIADYFYMTNEDCAYRENERYTVFQARVNKACYRLARRRLLENVARGWYRISYSGEDALERKFYIDDNYLKQLPEIGKGHLDSSRLPAPENPREFYELKEVTLDDIIEMRRTNTQVLNMLKQRSVVLKDGQLVEITDSIDRISCSSDAQYFAMVNQSIATGIPQKVEKDARTHSMRLSSPRLPSTVKSREMKFGNKDPFGGKPDVLDTFLANHPREDSVGNIMHDLLRKYYNISNAKLSQLSNVPNDTIKDLVKTNKKRKHTLRTIYAIAITLNFPPAILDRILECLNCDPNPCNEPDNTYMTIFSVSRNMSHDEINDYCRKKGITEIF